MSRWRVERLTRTFYRVRVSRGDGVTFTGPVAHLPWVGRCGCGLRVITGSQPSALDHICRHLKYDHQVGAS